jgi:acyl carrier protein
MDRVALRQALKAILEENVGRPFDAVTEDADLRADLGLDSVDLVTMMFEIQARFGVTLPGEELERLTKVRDVLDAVQAQPAAAGRPAA